MASGSTVDPLSSNLPSETSPWPSSILLAGEAYVAASRNDTTATARWRGNHTAEVTFWIADADPPAPSVYTFHCIKAVPNSNSEEAVPLKVAKVAGAEGRFVLLRVIFDSCYSFEYFIYKGHPKSPSLERVPHPNDHSMNALELAIVPRGDDGHYLLIDLCNDRDKVGDYRLHIYSSEDATWRTKELPNPCPGVRTIAPDKVFVIRDGLLLWVDLLHGMLVCDVLQEPHHAQYIPLPEPLLGNREQVKKFGRRVIRRIRDVTCVDGMIKFIEMEHREIEREITDGVPLEKPIDPRTKDVLYDSDLITLIKRKPVKPEIRIERLEDGWSAMTWTRKIGSNCWLKGHIVDVDDILVDDSVFSELLSGQRSEPESAGSLTFKNLHSTWPTLSTDGNDILYLRSSAGFGEGGALVAVDLAEKTLKVEAPGAHPFGKHFFYHSGEIWRPCALANHLKMTPGIEVSASQIARTGSSAKKEESFTNKQTEKASYLTATDSSANEPNNTSIGVGEPDSYESDKKRPRQAYSVH